MNVFRMIIDQFAWADLGYLRMIIEFIFDKNPDILAFPQFSVSQRSAMARVIDYLKKVPAEDLPYLKLIKSQSDLEEITSGKVRMFHIAAVAVAQTYGSSYDHLVIPTDKVLLQFHDAIQAYIAIRNQFGPMMAVHRLCQLKRTDMNRAEFKAFFTQKFELGIKGLQKAGSSNIGSESEDEICLTKV